MAVFVGRDWRARMSGCRNVRDEVQQSDDSGEGFLGDVKVKFGGMSPTLPLWLSHPKPHRLGYVRW